MRCDFACSSPVRLGFAAAIVTLFRGQQDVSADECAFLEEQGVSGVAVELVEVLLGASRPLSCLHSSSHPFWAPLIVDVYLALGVVLALNMLIAQMTTTYEKIREKVAPSYMFLNAMLMLSWFEQPAPPPPLQVLGAPYYFFRTLVGLLNYISRCSSVHSHPTITSKAAAPSSPVLSVRRSVRRLSADADALGLPYGQIQQETENSLVPSLVRQEREQEAHEVAAELRMHVEQQLLRNAGDRVGENERWRMRQACDMANLTQHTMGVEAKVDRLESELRKVRTMLEGFVEFKRTPSAN